MPMGQGCMMAWERGLCCCSRNRSDICIAPVPMGATIPQPIWGTRASSKNVAQKTRTIWVRFPQSYGIKSQRWDSPHYQAAFCHLGEVNTLFSDVNQHACTLLVVSQHKSQTNPRHSGGEIPSSSSQGILTSKQENFVHWRDACLGWGIYGPSPVWESDRLLFVWESGFISPYEKEARFIYCCKMLLLNTSLREA